MPQADRIGVSGGGAWRGLEGPGHTRSAAFRGAGAGPRCKAAGLACWSRWGPGGDGAGALWAPGHSRSDGASRQTRGARSDGGDLPRLGCRRPRLEGPPCSPRLSASSSRKASPHFLPASLCFLCPSPDSERLGCGFSWRLGCACACVPTSVRVHVCVHSMRGLTHLYCRESRPGSSRPARVGRVTAPLGLSLLTCSVGASAGLPPWACGVTGQAAAPCQTAVTTAWACACACMRVRACRVIVLALDRVP